MLSPTTQRGDAAVYLIASRLMAVGLIVLQPLSDSLPFDLAIYREGRFFRIQVKVAMLVKPYGRYCVPLRKMSPGKQLRIYRYTKEHTDFIVGVVRQTGDAYCFSIEEIEHIKAGITLDPDQTANVKYATNKRINPESHRNNIVLDGERIDF
jgi:hypothetical protein